MARHQHHSWHALTQRARRSNTNSPGRGDEVVPNRHSSLGLRSDPRRQLCFEPLEVRRLLSVSAGYPVEQIERIDPDTVEADSFNALNATPVLTTCGPVPEITRIVTTSLSANRGRTRTPTPTVTRVPLPTATAICWTVCCLVN